MTKTEISITNEDHEAFLREYRDILQKREPEEGGEKITLADAALSIFSQGVSRVRATATYATKQKKERGPAKPRAKKVAAPKLPKAKKVAAPKGPLARKVKAAGKAPAKAAAPRVRKTPTVTAPAASEPAPAVLD